MLKIIFFIILSIAMIIYLHFQAKEDLKDKTVPVLPNLIAMGTAGIIYLLGCLFTWSVPDFKGVLIAAVALLCMVIFRIFGKGDAKALFAMTLVSPFATPGSEWISDINVVLPVLTYLIATFAFIPANIKKGREEGTPWKEIVFGKNRSAFFPFLKIGYIVTFVISLLLQICSLKM